MLSMQPVFTTSYVVQSSKSRKVDRRAKAIVKPYGRLYRNRGTFWSKPWI